MDEMGFVWSFPCYILIGRYTENPRTGGVILDDNLTFVVGEIIPGGDQCVLIFTDSDLAQRHRLQCPQPRTLGLFEIESPSTLNEFLRLAIRNYRFVAVDINRETGRVHGYAITDVIASFERPIPPANPND